MDFIKTSVVEAHEDDHPWLRVVYDYIIDNGVIVSVRDDELSGRVFPESDRTRNSLPDVYVTEMELSTSGQRDKSTIVHEFAHFYTKVSYIVDDTAPMGIASLYIHYNWSWDPAFWVSPCLTVELVADMFTLGTLDIPVSQTSYWNGGPNGSNCYKFTWKFTEFPEDGLENEQFAVVEAADDLVIADWFIEEFDGDAPKVWEALLSYPTEWRSNILTSRINDGTPWSYVWLPQFRNLFGGYCSTDTDLTSADGRETVDNPWRLGVGGCDHTDPTAAGGDGLITVSWTAPGDDGTFDITGYRVQWKTGDEQFSADRQAELAATATTHTIEGLQAATGYTVRVVAFNAGGEIVSLGDIAVSTTANEPPRFVTGVSFSVLERDMHAQVTAVDDDATDDVVFDPDPDADDSAPYQVTGGADEGLFTIDVWGRLTFKYVPDYEHPADSGSDNVYEVVVTAYSGEGTRKLSAEQSITITVTDYDHEVPDTPVGPTVNTITDTSLAISWDEPTTTGPPIDGYEVRYRVSGAESWDAWPHSGTGRTADITGLQPATTYEVQVRATSAEGPSDWSRSPIKLTAVSAGTLHTCGINTAGTVVCWGANEYGQATPPEGTFTAVSAGDLHTCGINTAGTVACWGLNAAGQATPPEGTFTAVSAGLDHTCGIRTDLTAACWGNIPAPSAQFHSCGVHPGDGTAVCLPNDVAPVMTLSSITSGDGYTCGINTDGHLVCWGLGENVAYKTGLILKHYILDADDNPIQSATFTAVSAGNGSYSCVAKADGTLVCWRHLGNTPSPPPAEAFTAVATGHSHGCGIRTDSAVACWGDDEYGQATPPAGTFSAVSAGSIHTCGIRTDSTAVCWGFVGDGRTTPPAGTFSAIAVGESHSCGVADSGAVLCWGSGDYDEAAPPQGTFSAVTADYNHTCGILTDGDALCWGSHIWHEPLASVGAFTALTSGYDHTCALATGVAIACWGVNTRGDFTPPQGAFSAITADDFHTCALATGGTAVCWGHNPPVQPDPPSGNLTAIATGSDHTCAITTDGTAVCWGDDTHGQATPPSDSFSAIAAGHKHSCAIRTDSTVACWGRDHSGQATPPAGNFSAIDVSDYHSCGITTGGRAVCWGYDDARRAMPPTVITTATTTG